MKKLFLTWVSLLLATTSFASQTIQLYVQLPPQSPPATLIFVIDDIDQGKKTPYFMSLNQSQNLQTFHIAGNHYQINQWTIQASDISFAPCTATPVINNHSLIVNIIGKVAAGDLHCTLREVAAIPQLSTLQTTAPVLATAPNKASESKSGNEVIAAYLSALAKPCEKGTFQAHFDSQTVTYSILGMQAQSCDVSITTNNLAPLLCHLNKNDIALIASPTEIENYQHGSPAHTENSLSARIMQARCKPMATNEKNK